VSQLALLCQDPVNRLAELERFWLLPDDNWLPAPIPPTRRRKRREQCMSEQRANMPSDLDQSRAAPPQTRTAAIKGAPPPPPAPAAVAATPAAVAATPVEAAQVSETEAPIATAVEPAQPVESADASAQPKPTVQRGQAGGLAAQASGKAHKFTQEEARMAGKKGGAMSSRDRELMREIGHRGGKAKLGYRKRRAEKPDAVDGGELGSP
jgi:general stress protein YciG